jgi:hypothetical protein
MKPVKRHEVDRELVEEMLETERRGLESGIKIMIDQAEPRPLPIEIRNAIWIAGLQAALDPGSDEICVALRMAAAMSAGLFKLMIEMPGEYPIPLGDGRRAILHNIGVTSHTSVGTWIRGFYVAAIVRDRAALDQLAQTPVRELRRSPTTSDDCAFLWVEALQAWQRNESGVVAKLQAAIDATDPARLKIANPDYVLNLMVPEMQLLFRLIAREAAPFNEALQFALERHKKYWSGAKQKRDPEGFLALGPLAFAAMAHDAGIAVEVDSDYLPRRLVDGGCRA